MKRIFSITTLLLLLISAGCNQNADTGADESNASDQAKASDQMLESETEQVAPAVMAVAVMQSTSGSKLSGQVSFTEKDGKVTMKADLQGVLPAGDHAIHIHEKGDCSASDGTSAGGHWNPTGEKHGHWDDEERHQGDIGNMPADGAGNAEIILSTEEWCIGCDDPNKNIVGKSVIVHEGADDFTSQPSGAAGPRIGCGVISMEE